MADLVQGTGLVAKDGTASGEMQRWMKAQSRSAAELNAGKAAKAQTWEQSFLIEYPEDKDYRVVVNAAVARTITGVTTRTGSGTCTVTAKINTTALGGTANSASTGEQTQAHSSANEVAAGDDIVLTVSASASPTMLSVTLSGTLMLA